MEGQPPTKNGGSNDCRKFWMSFWPSLTGKSPEHPQSGTASDQTFFYSPEEVVNFNLHLSGDVGIIVVLEHDLLCGDLSRVFGLKTNSVPGHHHSKHLTLLTVFRLSPQLIRTCPFFAENR